MRKLEAKEGRVGQRGRKDGQSSRIHKRQTHLGYEEEDMVKLRAACLV